MKIVIVDDTPLNLLLMVKLVDRLPGIESSGFESPREALTWCAETEPYLIIVDYMMPDIDGLDFIRRVRASHKASGVPSASRISVVRPASLNDTQAAMSHAGVVEAASIDVQS